MIETLINLANFSVALAVLYLVTCACNAMSKRTRHVIVAAYIAVGVAAIGSGLGPWLDHRDASKVELVGNAGLALMLWATRRKTVLAHARRGVGQ